MRWLNCSNAVQECDPTANSGQNATNKIGAMKNCI